MPSRFWTEARTAKLKEMHALGHTAREIAAAFGGGLSRDAVIGKLSRLTSGSPAQRPSGCNKNQAADEEEGVR
jgi:hypothetical protein